MTSPGEPWSQFTRDPRDPQVSALRASDQDRSVAAQVLAEAYADGRLDRSEHDERSELVTGARTLGELAPPLLDLVAPAAPAGATTRDGSLVRASTSDLEELAHRAWQHKRREALFGFLGPSLVCTAIWFATCWGDGGFEPYFFWPGFVMIATLLNVLRTVFSRSEIVEREVHRLEKRRAKELRVEELRARPEEPPAS